MAYPLQALSFFCTTGTLATASFPTALNGAGTAVTTTYASGAFKAGDNIVLHGIVCLKAPAADDTITLKDSAGVAILPAITIMSSGSNGNPLFSQGIPLPRGGFSVTTAQAGTIYMFLFDREASVV